MAGFYKSPFRVSDESEYDWLTAREGGWPHWLELRPVEEKGEPAPSRRVTARPGDSISRIIGSSDPTAIGAFARANGLRPGDSTIYAGKSYVRPSGSSGTADDRGEGLLMLRRDNGRLSRLQAQSEQEQASLRLQRAELTRALDESSYMPRGVFPMRAQGSSLLPRVQRPPSWLSKLDRNPWVKGIAGGLAEGAARGPGALRGAWHSVEDLASLADLGFRLSHPITDLMQNGPRGSAWVETAGAGLGAVDFAKRVQRDPSIIWQGIKKKGHQLNVELNPGASPMADTILGEVRRRIPVGMNQGELGLYVASTAYGGSELRLLNGMNRVRKTLAGPALIERYGPASQAALAAPYVEGMGSHFPIGRALGKRLGIPEWIVESPLNVSRPPGLTKLEMYMYHGMVDPDFYGAKLPRGLDRPGFRFRDFGGERFNSVERLLYGASPALKATVGGATGAGIGFGRYAAEEDYAQH